MSTDAVPRQTTVTGILGRALEPKGGKISPEGARFILDLGIRDEDQQRALELLAKRREGQINEEEASELASHIQADNLLSILRAKALLALNQAGQEP